MRFLVTGAAGFIGSHLCDRLVRDDHHVIGMDDFSTGDPANLAGVMTDARFSLIEHDTSQFTYVEPALDGIFHLAQPSSFLDFQDDPLQTVFRSLQSALRTLDLARRKEARYLLASSGEVYGSSPAAFLSETDPGVVDPLKPRGIFAEAKRLTESITTAHRTTYGLDTRIARIFDVYGPRMRTDGASPIANFVLQAVAGDPLTVYGDGQQIRSFCYVDDVVDGLVKLFFSDHVDPVNLGGAEAISIETLAARVLQITESTSAVSHLPPIPGDTARRVPDLTRGREVLDWAPTLELWQGLERTIPYLEARARQEGVVARSVEAPRGFL